MRMSGRRIIPDGTVLAMLMIEDPGALKQVVEIADVPVIK